MKLPFYYREKDDVIEKVLVNYDKKKLRDLKYEIADNCTIVVHKEFDGTKRDRPDILMCNKYREVQIGVSSSKLYECAPDEPLYHFSYDERVLPRLVQLIMEIESGNLSAVEEILNPIEVKDVSYEERIRELSNEIDKISNSEYDLKIQKLESLRLLIEEKIRNDKVKSDKEYYSRVLELIDIVVIDSIPKEEILRVEKFFDEEYPSEMHINYKEYLKRKTKEKKL